jgi:hypothetical protein
VAEELPDDLLRRRTVRPPARLRHPTSIEAARASAR